MVQHILPFGDVTDRSITLPIRVTPNPRDAASFESINCDDALIQTTVPLCFSVINETSSARADGSGTAIDTVPLLGEPPQMTPSVLVRVAVLGAIGSISLIANVMALASIFRMRQRRISSHNSSLYTLLAHMAVADLLVTLFCIVAEACWTYTIEWMADVYTCKTLKYAQLFSLYLSTFILIVLALDQLLIVRYPLRKDTNIVTIRRAIISAWIVAALLSVPQVGSKHKGSTSFLFSTTIIWPI